MPDRSTAATMFWMRLTISPVFFAVECILRIGGASAAGPSEVEVRRIRFASRARLTQLL